MGLDVVIQDENDNIVYNSDITHNVGLMAEKVSLEFYKSIWRPEELYNEPKSSDIVKEIEKGLTELVLNKAKYDKYEPENGWGGYKDLVLFVIHYLEKLKEYHNCKIFAER